MNSVFLTKILNFCRENDGTIILDCQEGLWDVLITWGDKKAYGSGRDFTRALRIAWREITK
jgi:hypothetical protein